MVIPTMSDEDNVWNYIFISRFAFENVLTVIFYLVRPMK